MLADAVDEGLGGSRPLYDALADYERRRNEATLTDYRMNIARASFAPLSAEERQVMEALPGNQATTDRYFLAREGMIPRDWFFNPGNLARVIATAASSQMAIAS